MSQLPASVPPDEPPLLLELLVEPPLLDPLLDPDDPLELPDDPLLADPLLEPELEPPLDALPELLAPPLPDPLDPELPLSSPEDPPSPPPPELSSPDSLPRPASPPPSSAASVPESSPLLPLLDALPELDPKPELAPNPELEPRLDPLELLPLPVPWPVSFDVSVESPLAQAATTRVVTTSQLERLDRRRMVLLSVRGSGEVLGRWTRLAVSTRKPERQSCRTILAARFFASQASSAAEDGKLLPHRTGGRRAAACKLPL